MHLTTVVPLVDEPLLEVVDRVVAALDLLRRRQPAHPGDQHVLVVRAVEDADHPGARAPRLSTRHRKSWRQLLLGRRLERLDPHALRVDQADGVPHDAALAGGVHALEHQQDAALPAGPALGEQPLLEVGQLVAQRVERRLALRLVAVEAGLRRAGRTTRGRPVRAGRSASR